MILQDKTILITGASSGIGYQLAVQLSEFNCRLILVARRGDLLKELAEKLNDKCKISFYRCDVSSKEETRTIFQKIVYEYGKIDIAILNSGVDQKTRVTRFNSEDAVKTIGVNFFGLVNWIELLLPAYMQERRGMIVGVTSLADARGFSGSGYYCASKAAASHLLESLRIDLKDYGVKVITVKPGFVKTPMTDKNDFYMPFLIDARRAAEIIVRGIIKGKSVIEFPLPTSLGAKIVKCMPNAIFEFISRRKNMIRNK